MRPILDLHLAFLNQWLLTPVAALPTTQAQIDALHPWNGERLFQAGKFGTEMQYQHLVFEESPTIQPQVDEFLAAQRLRHPINPAIFAEFAHTVYRLGIRCSRNGGPQRPPPIP